MGLKASLYGLLTLWASAALAGAGEPPPARAPARAVSAADAAAWGFGLIAVLGVFFLCVWGLRKLGGFNPAGSQKLRLLGGLSLGVRERIVLLQAGRKQLVLGVTPGRIQTLLVLEGDDCIPQDASSVAGSGNFAEKLALFLRPGQGNSGRPP